MGIKPVNMRRKPEVGKRYGALTIISEETSRSNDKKVLFKVRCSCGKEQFIRPYFLEIGRQTCCKECRSRINYYKAVGSNTKVGFIKLHHEGIGNFTRTTYSYFKRNAKRRGVSWSDELTIDYLYDMLLKQNKKCALSGVDIDLTEVRKASNVDFLLMTASIDRIDSSKGYTPDNIQWVHKDVNRMKWAFPQERFIEMCKLITNHANQQGS